MQSTLHADLIDYFADPAAHCTTVVTVDRRKGRTERRAIRVSTELVPHIERFAGVAQVFQISREVTSRDGSHTDVDYFITSCTAHEADPDRLLALARGQRSIERLHWLRDVAFGEDASHVRTDSVPQFLAALRNAILTVFPRAGTTASAAARRTFAAHPSKALALVAQSVPVYR